VSAEFLMTRFCPLTHCTTGDIGFNILLESNPNVVSAYQFGRLTNSRMTSKRRIMASSKYLQSSIVVFRQIDPTIAR